jgi:hypothetical protein
MSCLKSCSTNTYCTWHLDDANCNKLRSQLRTTFCDLGVRSSFQASVQVTAAPPLEALWYASSSRSSVKAPAGTETNEQRGVLMKLCHGLFRFSRCSGRIIGIMYVGKSSYVFLFVVLLSPSRAGPRDTRQAPVPFGCPR